MADLAVTLATRWAPALVLAVLTAGCGSKDRVVAPPAPSGPPVLLAFVSTRPPTQPFYGDIYFYDAATGGPAYLPPNLSTPSPEGPIALSGDGRTLAYSTTRSLVGSIATVLLYDVATARITIPRALNTLNGPQNPSLSFDGRYLAAQYQVAGPFDQYLTIMDVPADTLLPVPNINEPGATNFDPSINGDGTLVAFANDGVGSLGGFDVRLYSVPADSFLPLPGLNSNANDLGASVSADGRYIAFQSGRPGGAGIIDIYLYDRQTESLVPLPGANTNLAETQPGLSPDGRYLTFTTDADGGGDVRLYDVSAQTLIDLSKLNDPYFNDHQPVVVGQPGAVPVTFARREP